MFLKQEAWSVVGYVFLFEVRIPLGTLQGLGGVRIGFETSGVVALLMVFDARC